MQSIPTEPGAPFQYLLKQIQDLEGENIAKAIPKELFAPRVWRGLLGFAASLSLYVGAIVLVSMAHWSLWLPLWIAAGLGAWGLHCIAHDCGHRSFSRSKRFNNFLGQLSLLPMLYPFHAWRHVHNLHHMNTNHIERDGDWRPITYDMYLRRSSVNRFIYRGSRSFFFWIGTVFYWRVSGFTPTLYPSQSMRDEVRGSIVIVCAWAALYFPVLIYFTGWTGLLMYFIAPWIASHAWFSTTTLMQHTGEDVPFLTREHWRASCSRGLMTTDYNYPKWLHFLTHNISVHTAHHVAPVIPFYNLGPARAALKQAYPRLVREQDFSLAALWRIVTQCHFYDPKHGFYLSYARARGLRQTDSAQS